MPKVKRAALTKVQEAEARLVPRYCPLRVNTPKGKQRVFATPCGKRLKMDDGNLGVSPKEYRLYCPTHGYIPFNGATI